MFDAKFLRNTMIEEGLTIKALSQKSNVTLTTICLALKGKRNPSLLTISKLARALDKSPDDFFTD